MLDTLRANLDNCVGMAANMIGVKKNIIVVAAGPFQFAMINPVIAKKSGTYRTEEGCLSLEGAVPAPDTRRLRWITLTRALRNSMENIQAGQHRLCSMRLTIVMAL